MWVPGCTVPVAGTHRCRPPWPQDLTLLRKHIEADFRGLVRGLHLHVGRVRTFWSLRARVNLKIAAHHLIHSRVLA